jgi:hypothetical protein
VCDIIRERVIAGDATRIGCDIFLPDTIVDAPVRARPEISEFN